MVTRNVVLTDAQSDLVEQLITQGRYQNASEALRAGLRLLEREEMEIADIKTRLSTSFEQAKDGDFAEGSGVDAINRAFTLAYPEARKA